MLTTALQRIRATGGSHNSRQLSPGAHKDFAPNQQFALHGPAFPVTIRSRGWV